MSLIQHLLIIDDDESALFITDNILKSANLVSKVSKCTGAKEALQFIRNGCPDENGIPTSPPEVILLDINMPIHDGWDFIELFHELPDAEKPNSDIYILSSSIRRQDQLKAANNPHIKGYFIKPLNEEVFEQKVVGVKM